MTLSSNLTKLQTDGYLLEKNELTLPALTVHLDCSLMGLTQEALRDFYAIDLVGKLYTDLVLELPPASAPRERSSTDTSALLVMTNHVDFNAHRLTLVCIDETGFCKLHLHNSVGAERYDRSHQWIRRWDVFMIEKCSVEIKR